MPTSLSIAAANCRAAEQKSLSLKADAEVGAAARIGVNANCAI
jgi:hypothetical protein